MSRRVLVAGVGNIFLGDDGFGVEVAQRLAREPLPDGVKVVDFGIRGVHLAYEMLDGYDTTILIDAAPRGGVPGTLYVLEPQLNGATRQTPSAGAALMDAHGMEPDAIFALLDTLGGTPGRLLVVGCEPAEIDEQIGLSEAVAQAVDGAVQLVRDAIDTELRAAAETGNGGRDALSAHDPQTTQEAAR